MTQAAQLAQYGANNVGLSFKNRVINGDMSISQRNGTSSVTPTDGQYLLDRWLVEVSQTSKLSVQQNAGSVTPPVGFTNYFGATSLSAYSIVASDYFTIEQRIEGFNLADLGWGTANAATVTLSFWVRSSLTGTFGGSLVNSGNSRSYPFTYTISAANTWEQKTIPVAGDTSGTWLTNNGIGMIISLSLGMGSTRSATAGSWAAGNFLSATGATSVVGTSGATFYITGVQLEKGTVATSFDYLDYGRELMLCQRYYEKSFPIGTVPANGLDGPEPGGLTAFSSGSGRTAAINFCVNKRASPTITYFRSQLAGTDGQWHFYIASGAGWTSATSTVTQNAGQNCFVAVVERSGSFSSGTSYLYAGGWTASAEL
jgi:hypothetical protein